MLYLTSPVTRSEANDLPPHTQPHPHIYLTSAYNTHNHTLTHA